MRIFITTVLCAFVTYLIFAFVSMQYNPTEWLEVWRANCVIITVLLTLVLEINYAFTI
jgi:hypothetical protein